MAVVNSQPITRQQLAQECLRRYGTDVLETMVNKQLIIGACQQRGITISQQDIEQEVDRIAAKWGLSIDRWYQLLSKERNITPKQYTTDIVWPTLALRKLAAPDIQVSPKAVEEMLMSDLGPKVQVRLIALANQADAEMVRAKAVAEPDSFPKLAQDHSVDKNSASTGGLILPIRRFVGNLTVEEVAFRLQEGQISEVFHAANQYLILKCEKRMEGPKISPAQEQAARERIVEHLREKKLREIADGLFKTLQQQSKITKVINDKKMEQQYPGVAAIINGRQITVRQLAEECIVRHGHEVLDGEINRKILEQAMQQEQLSVVKADLDREVARAAVSYGFENENGQANINGWLEHVTQEEGATVELYVRDAVWPTVALKKLIGNTVAVTEEDLQRGYDSNYGPRAEVLVILMTNHRQANQIWTMAKNNPTEKFFGDLANQYSVEPISRANFGRVPPIQRYGGRPTMEDVAFKLKPGDISGLVNVENKWIIMYCLGFTKPIVTDRTAVRDELTKDIHEKKLRLAMAKEYDRLRESAQIDNFLAGTSQSGNRANIATAPNAPSNSRVPFQRNGNSANPLRK